MDRDTIIRLAREAGYIGMQFTSISTLERFAALVAAHEREECAKVLESMSDAPDMQAYAAAIRSRT